MLLQSQVKRASAKVFLKIMKALKNQDGTGFAMMFDKAFQEVVFPSTMRLD